MKKYLALVLAVVMAFGVITGCGKNEPKVDKKTEQQGEKQEEKQEEVNMLAEKSLEDILNSIYEELAPEFPVMNTEVDFTDEDSVKYFTGLTKEDAGKVKEALVSESAMGSQAYSLVLLRVNDAKDAEAVAKAVKEGVDPRKWICVEADDQRAAAHGDVVIMIMVSTVFEESITAEQMTEAFKKIAGGSLSVDLK